MVETKEYNEDNKEQIETYQRLYRQSIRHQIAYNNKPITNWTDTQY